MTVALGAMLVDVCAVSYRDDREKVILHVFDEDLADVVKVLTGRA